MKKHRILHIAPANTSGVPGQFVQAERRLGYDSRLVTLFSDRRGYFTDICLNLPLIDMPPVRWIKKILSDPDKLRVDNRSRQPDRIPLTWKPHTRGEAVFVSLRDRLWKPRIQQAVKQYGLDQFDVIQLDGGLGLYRNADFVLAQKQKGRTLICCYTGSDLRTRGVIPAINAASDLNVTVEFDHVRLHPDIHHVPFPFHLPENRVHSHHDNTRPVRIGHAPTNRAAKGSNLIIPVLKKLESDLNTETILIEGMSYTRAMQAKQSCDIFVDQIGDLGYGINALEALAMEIPVASCLADGFEQQYPDHPFIRISAQTLYDRLQTLIKDPKLRWTVAAKGKAWLMQTHDADKVVQRIHRLAHFD